MIDFHWANGEHWKLLFDAIFSTEFTDMEDCLVAVIMMNASVWQLKLQKPVFGLLIHSSMEICWHTYILNFVFYIFHDRFLGLYLVLLCSYFIQYSVRCNEIMKTDVHISEESKMWLRGREMQMERGRERGEREREIVEECTVDRASWYMRIILGLHSQKSMMSICI